MKNKSEKKKLDGNSFLLIVTIILFFAMHIVDIIMLGRGGFAKVQSFLNLFISNASLTVVATGMIIVMVTGGIDASIGSVVAMVYMMLAWVTERGNVGMLLAILIALVTGHMFGLAQSFLVVYLEIQPFIMTLAGIFFARGMTSIISQEMTSITDKTFTGITTFKIYLPFEGYLNKKGVMTYPYVYPSAIIALVVLTTVFVVPKHTKFGHSIYAISENGQSALLLGLNARRIKLQAYILDGLLIGLGGLLLYIDTCSSLMKQAKGFRMDVIAFSAIGGTLLIDSVGNVIESLFGVLTKSIIESFIALQGALSSWWMRITIAAPFCFFIVPQSLIMSLKRESK